MNIERRIEKAEQRLCVDQEPVVHLIVNFGNGSLPPGEKRGNVIVRHVHYSDICDDVGRGDIQCE
jgi:hypothetical protein